MDENNNANPIEESVLSVLGLTHASEAELVMLAQKMSELVQRRVMIRLIDRISGQQIEELDGYIKLGREDQINEFINEHAPDFYELIQGEAERLREEMKDVITEVEEKLERDKQ